MVDSLDNDETVPGPLIVSFGISLLVIFYIIHSPHCPLNILYSLEALVETEVVADSVLKQ